ncbi:MAG: hypothetical protein MK102_03295 [Fuerstiella sp.]|nr:hypothetical protein [Fuerstiella sp.]
MAVETSQALQQLHHLLQQLEDAETMLAHGPRRVAAAKNKVTAAELVCEEHKNEIQTLRKTSDQKSLNLKSNEDMILKLNGRLNEASSNKEFDIIQAQLESERLASDALEDEVLSLLSKVDDAEVTLRAAEQDVRQLIERGQEIKADVQAKEPGVREEIERLNREITEAESAIPAGESRGNYERLRASMKSGALSELRKAFCLACNTKVIAQDCVRVKIGEFVTCRECGRILYSAE